MPQKVARPVSLPVTKVKGPRCVDHAPAYNISDLEAAACSSKNLAISRLLSAHYIGYNKRKKNLVP